MMNVSEMIREIEDILVLLESGYSTEQWENKKSIDKMRYDEAKKLRNKIDEKFYSGDVINDVDDNEFEYLLSELDIMIRNYEDKIV